MDNNSNPPYERESAPKLGIVTNSIKEFNDAGKEHGEKGIRTVFEMLKNKGYISKESVYYGKRIFGYHEARTAAEEFSASRVEVILIFNSAFPNGYVFPLIAMNPLFTSGVGRLNQTITSTFMPRIAKTKLG